MRTSLSIIIMTALFLVYFLNLDAYAQRCPTCKKDVGIVYQCDKCGDIRCGVNTRGACNSKEGPFGTTGQGASAGGICKLCKKGKYHRLG